MEIGDLMEISYETGRCMELARILSIGELQ
jgi:hypothetical protein